MNRNSKKFPFSVIPLLPNIDHVGLSKLETATKLQIARLEEKAKSPQFDTAICHRQRAEYETVLVEISAEWHKRASDAYKQAAEVTA
jgi:hypothetical protein